MEFTNTFHVPAGVDETFAALCDLERIAPCVPGAEHAAVTDDTTHTGSVRVKVGPITADYEGMAQVVEADLEAGQIRVTAMGDETKGAGTANAELVATLVAADAGTEVTVVTDLEVTGKPAQFGRAVLGQVGTRLAATFAERLADLLAASEPATTDAADEAPAADDELAATDPLNEDHGPPPASEQDHAERGDGAPETSEPDEPEQDDGAGEAPEPDDAQRAGAPIDLADLRAKFMAGGPGVRIAPVVAVLALLAAGVWWWSRRRR